MSKERLPVAVDPLRMAQTARLLEGEVALAGLLRLKAATHGEPEGSAQVRLEFVIDSQGTPTKTARISAQVMVVCQRCLEPLWWDVESNVSYAIVTSQAEMNLLPDLYEPLLVEDGSLYIQDVVEDELLLSLPLVPKHPEGECPVSYQERGSEGDETHTGERENPFAVLSDLKTKH